METKVFNINNFKIQCFLHYLEIVVRIGSAMVKVGQRGPEEMVSQLPTQGAQLDTCYKLAQPDCQVGVLEMSSSVKKNTRQCLS